ncbi:hypothetical protein QUF61_09115 [Candidatus Venteria ishoeyi]|uniref:hypothetical protein n=1 Tax=Candidatus Venteria ishoeyi TaxID=1899563 RepID=UPI0025A640A6|nr:hypothetical protein [Candidatus Venteria ishoeyi]MDM8546637.1 hypothetical protein [Candidatus Venteria ishoeyi]
MTEKQTKTYEMMWDCKFCGTTKLLGKTHRYCPACGAAQDPEQRYYPSDQDKVAVEDHQFIGADKLCQACDTPNAANVEFCISCGSPMSEAAQAKVRDSQLRATDESFSETRQADQLTDQATAEKAQLAAQQAKKKKQIWIIAGVAVVIALIATFLLWSKEVTVELQQHRWEYSIQIEQYRAQAKASWCDAMPHDAYRINRSEKVRSHKQVADGQECSMRRIDQGDGTYQEKQECRTRYRKEPIYDQYCNYQLNRWAHNRAATSQGQDKKPRWASFKLACGGQRQSQKLGCEREGQRLAQHYLMLSDKQNGKTYQCEVQQALWQQSQLKSRWHLDINLAGSPRCGTLEPLR